MRNESEIIKILQSILYPKLEKNIVELKIIDSLHVEKDLLKITLDTNNKEAFTFIETQIKKKLNTFFSKISIEQKQKNTSKSLSYGSTKNPNNRAPYAKKIIAVSSGKGGVGKSTLSVNLAVGLAQEGFKVGLLDADVYGPNVPRLLGIENEKLSWNEENKIIPHENFGIKIMSVGFTTPTFDTPLVWRSSVAISALVQFLEDVAWGTLDFLVIDMPPGTGDVQLSMAEELPLSGAIIVTTPQSLSIDDVSRAIMMFKETHVKILGVVENMSFFEAPDTHKVYEIFGQSRLESLCRTYTLKPLGKIPLAIEIRELSDAGRIPVAFSKHKNIYKEICKKVVEEA
jgi:ATP-binding protein involved in chromosome partitioning